MLSLSPARCQPYNLYGGLRNSLRFFHAYQLALPPKVNIQLIMDFITYNNNHYWYPTLWISNNAMLSNDLKFIYKTLKVYVKVMYI